MQPQLHDLADGKYDHFLVRLPLTPGTPAPVVQKRLKMVAKILHNIAFPSDGPVERDSDIALHAHFIQVSKKRRRTKPNIRLVGRKWLGSSRTFR